MVQEQMIEKDGLHWMSDDIIILYGKKRQYRQDNSVVLLTDLIDDYISEVDVSKIISDDAIIKFNRTTRWLANNGITEEDVTIGMYYYKMVHTFSTSVRYFIIFDKMEHRTLFYLCKDHVLGTE